MYYIAQFVVQREIELEVSGSIRIAQHHAMQLDWTMAFINTKKKTEKVI